MRVYTVEKSVPPATDGFSLRIELIEVIDELVDQVGPVRIRPETLQLEMDVIDERTSGAPASVTERHRTWRLSVEQA